MTLEGSASLGDDVLGINTFLRPGTRGLYNLYIVDPSEQQIRAYPPAADGSGFPAKPTPWLATARDVSQMTSTYVDGDIFVADGGQLLRFVGGKAEGWDREGAQGHRRSGRRRSTRSWRPGRPAARARSTASTSANAPVIALSKVDGSFKAQYRLAGGKNGLDRLSARCTSSPAPRVSPSTLVWMDATASTRRSSSRSPTRHRREPEPSATRASPPLRRGDPEAHQEALTGATR